jgi:hypothetical protein
LIVAKLFEMSSNTMKVTEAPCGCISCCEETYYYRKQWEEGCTYHGGYQTFNPRGVTLDIFNSDVAELEREINKLKKKQKRKLKVYEDLPTTIVGGDVAELQRTIGRLEKKLKRKLEHRDAITQASKVV